MKRSDALKKIVKILKPWENSILNKKCANEILTMLEHMGMCPPFALIENDNPESTVIFVETCEWEDENA